jgi:hypothetical protein
MQGRISIEIVSLLAYVDIPRKATSRIEQEEKKMMLCHMT